MIALASRVAVLSAAIALLALAGCGDQALSPRSTVELMDDPALLQAVLARCNQSGAVQRDVECIHAREAVVRLEAAQSEAQRQKQAAVQSEFERAREERRRREELEREREEAREKVDPYTMPLVKDPMNPPQQTTALESVEPTSAS